MRDRFKREMGRYREAANAKKQKDAKKTGGESVGKKTEKK